MSQPLPSGGAVLTAAVSYEPAIEFDTPVELFRGPFALDLMGWLRELEALTGSE